MRYATGQLPPSEGFIRQAIGRSGEMRRGKGEVKRKGEGGGEVEGWGIGRKEVRWKDGE